MIYGARGFKFEKPTDECLSRTMLQLYWERDPDTDNFLWIFENFVNFLIEHLQAAASETVTENSLGNSAVNEKCHIISHVDVWLGSKWGSAQRIILGNRIKSVENKALLEC